MNETIKNMITEVKTAEDRIPVVYMTKDISSESLMSIYKALGIHPEGKVAVKISTGEPPKSNYLRPELIKDLVQSMNGTIVECNTAYGGARSTNEYHYQVAKDHGFTAIAPFDLQDAEGSMTLAIENGEVIKENYVGKSFPNYDYYLILSHFKGHQMAGFGGAIKNISIGLASSEGKSWIHSGGNSKIGLDGEQDAFLKSMAEAGKSVANYLGDRIAYINVLNRLSIDCDCNGNPAEPDIHDIGILASLDPVALDKASVDLVSVAEGNESFMNRIYEQNGLLTLEHATKMQLGSQSYYLEEIDNK